MRLRATNTTPQLPYLKSPRELAQMRKAGIVNWGAHQLIGSLIAPGVTSGFVDAAVDRYFSERNAIPLFKGVPGKIPFPSVCCMSINDEVVHGIPGGRVLKEGDIISVDTGCKLNGWCADSAVTYRVGRVHPEMQRLLDV